MPGALLGTRPARPGVLLLGAPPPPAPPDAWPPAGLTDSQKLDLILSYIGPPRTDLLPGEYTLTELLLVLLGIQEP
jgi:hypothetical protein